MGQVLKSSLAGQLWLGASHEAVGKMSAGLQLSEGSSGAEGLTSKVLDAIWCSVLRTPQFSPQAFIWLHKCPHDMVAGFLQSK